MAGKIRETINYVVWKALPSCKDVTSLLSKSLDGSLTFKEKLIMKIHLWTCIACQRYLSQIQVIGEVFEKQAANIEPEKSSPRLSTEAAERLKDAIRQSELHKH